MVFAHSGTHGQNGSLFALASHKAEWPQFLFFFFSSILLLQRVPHALHHFSLREVRLLPSFGHFSINERISLVPHKVAQQMPQLAHVVRCGWWRSGGGSMWGHPSTVVAFVVPLSVAQDLF